MNQEKPAFFGFFLAILIVAAWLGHLIWALGLDLSRHWLWIGPAILLQTWLFTGLFIVAHDAIHLSLLPRHVKMNHLVGSLAVFLYALLNYKRLARPHWDHHRFPASARDPDYHDGKQRHFAAWYVRFMRHYVTWPQIFGMAVIFNLLHYGGGISVAQLLILWVLPALLSTLQLFYFGTFLPHREPPHGYDNRHRARTNDYPPWLSLLTCFHFGYHWEHHAFPGLAWWQLPRKRKEIKKINSI